MIVTVIFLLLALLLAAGILVAVALPHLRSSRERRDQRAPETRHRSRTGE